MESSAAIPTRPVTALAPVLLLLLSLGEMGLLYRLHLENGHYSAEAAQGVVAGLPHWRIYQSRVLGPYAIEAVRRLGGLSALSATYLVYGVLVLAKNAALFAALRRHCGPGGALLRTAAATLLFLCLQDFWLYPWDLIDIIVSAGIVHLALCDPPLRTAWAVFALALFNRESSLFVGAWLMLDGALAAGPAGRLPLRLAWREPRKIAAGAAMVAIGLAATELLRSLLLIHATRGTARDAIFMLDRNVTNLGVAVAARDPVFVGLYLAFLGFLGLTLAALWGPGEQRRKLALLCLAEMLLIALFGLMVEPRVFSGLLPFLVALPLAAARPQPASPIR